jgi:predicted AAA+ superfamily ATPase
LNKRLIKSPKLYFLDAGLAAYLAGWRDSEMARFGPMGGALFEAQVFGNIVRQLNNTLTDGAIYFWRTRDGAEIDFLVEARGSIQPVEVKLGCVSSQELVALARLNEPNWRRRRVISLAYGAVNDRGGGPVAISADWSAGGPASLEELF